MKVAGAMFPAFTHVGAARALADCMEVERAHDALQVLVPLSAEKLDAQPSGRGCTPGGGTSGAGELEMIWNGVAMEFARNAYFTRFLRSTQTQTFSEFRFTT